MSFPEDIYSGPCFGSYTLGNGQAVTRTYDANYRLTDLTSPAFSLHVARDAMGDITALGNAPGANPATETYGYDPLYRLTAITEANGSVLESATYNPTGDRLSKTGSGLATGAYSYKPNTHQLIATGSYARAVDANGNTTGITAASGNWGFGYNNRNRLAVAQIAGSTVANYTYDALGERIGKVTGTASERYGYDEGQQLLSEQGATNRDYVWMDDIPVANVDTTGTTRNIAYVTADQLGTPRAMSDVSGTTVWQLPYQGNAWGEVAPTSASGYTYNLRFPGQYFDVETGLSNNVNRDYDPSIGRYIESDPVGLFGNQINTYDYASNNTLYWMDPSGLDVTIIIKRQGYSSTGNTMQGTITVSSDKTSDTYSGYTMENAHGGNNGDKGPIPVGTYDAFVRTDHHPNRLELENVPGYLNIQVHNGNYPRDFKGCFGVGNTHKTDFLGDSRNALRSILSIVSEDGSGNISVSVLPPSTPSYVPFDSSLSGPPGN